MQLVNLLVEPGAEGSGPGHLYVTDFGITRPLARRTRMTGTLDYLAPEQALNSRSADVRSDLYSLGCTFYFLLAGKVPFPGGSAAEKLLKHRLDEPTPVEQLRREVPAGVGAVVRRLMAEDGNVSAAVDRILGRGSQRYRWAWRG